MGKASGRYVRIRKVDSDNGVPYANIGQLCFLGDLPTVPLQGRREGEDQSVDLGTVPRPSFGRRQGERHHGRCIELRERGHLQWRWQSRRSYHARVLNATTGRSPIWDNFNTVLTGSRFDRDITRLLIAALTPPAAIQAQGCLRQCAVADPPPGHPRHARSCGTWTCPNWQLSRSYEPRCSIDGFTVLRYYCALA